MTRTGDIRVGSASWTDPSLVKSGWYPKASDAKARLEFYSSQFPLVEVDASYYAIPKRQTAEAWVERTPDDFVFNIKAFSLMTGHPAQPKVLPKYVKAPDKRNVYPKDLSSADVDKIWDEFANAIQPLEDAGKLGVVLFQFPPWFPISRVNKAYVLECAKRMAPLPICVEFRHNSWMRDDNQKETLELLEGHGLPYVCVDMPQGFRNSVPPVLAATADLAVMRFHGHNDAEWESRSVQRRFAYLYSDEELKDWAPKLQKLASEATETHVLMNNCYTDYAVRNAQTLVDLLDE